jgi:transglutaminase-like putative cysteine protease
VQINHPELGDYTGTVVPIGEGSASIQRTTRIMAQWAAQYALDPHIQAQAISITQLNQPKDSPSEIRALFDFVRNTIRYAADPFGTETVRSPDKTLLLRAGDCDDKSLLLATLLRAMGYNAFFVVTGYTLPGVFEHVYVGVTDDPIARVASLAPGEYLALDTTEPYPMGWEAASPVAFYIEPIPG